MLSRKPLNLRQRTRAAVLVASLLLFPVTIFFFSPVLILHSASLGIVNGSLLVFAAMFLSALFLGRFYCGWVCPAGAQGELAFHIQPKPINRKLGWIKWAIWIPWVISIGIMAVSVGGYTRIEPFFGIEGGLPLLQPVGYMIYLAITGLTLALSLTLGRRGFCYTVCWMAPFMILGRKAANLLRLPGLRLVTTDKTCSACRTCVKNCPMSLDVYAMVKQGNMEHSDCILCGSCVDGCTNRVIAYKFAAPQSLPLVPAAETLSASQD